MSDPNQRPTMSMIWTFLLFTVQRHAETSPAVKRAWDRMPSGGGGKGRGPTPEQIAEEMAQEHFPSGMVNGTGWQFYASGKPEPFWDVFDHEGSLNPGSEDPSEDDVDMRFFSGVCETLTDPLSPTDPAHVAMVARALALSQAMDCGIGGFLVKLKSEVYHGKDGAWVQIRGATAQHGGSPAGVGQFFPGLTASAHVGEALFTWFLDRHVTEIRPTLDRIRATTCSQA